MKAINFKLNGSDQKSYSLEDLLSGYKYLLLYFYPKDDTPGCTTEACSFRDASNDLEKLKVRVVGISSDSLESHINFIDKHSLNFLLLSDPEKKVSKQYGAVSERSIFGKKYQSVKRVSFLINQTKEIVKEYKNVNPLFHTKEVLSDLKKLEEK